MSEELRTNNLSVYYGEKCGVRNVTLTMPKNSCTALIGPSGCGKSTFLRSLNRMNERIEGVRIEGDAYLGEQHIFFELGKIEVRRRVGMVFQKPNPFPQSIYDNVAAAPKRVGMKAGEVLDGIVEQALIHVNLWDEVKDKLKTPALALSGGQQQRLCIARALASNPQALLLDEPTSALDPISARVIEELIMELSQTHTIVLVTHTMQQAERVADQTAFFYMGELIEAGSSDQIFNNPQHECLQHYLSGSFS